MAASPLAAYPNGGGEYDATTKQWKPPEKMKLDGEAWIVAGNSDGDYQMPEWTNPGEGKRLGLIVHHTDAERERAYDRDSSTGRLDRGLTDADTNGWLPVDMEQDWKKVFPFH